MYKEVEVEIDFDEYLTNNEVIEIAEQRNMLVFDPKKLTLVESQKIESFMEKRERIPEHDLNEFLNKY